MTSDFLGVQIECLSTKAWERARTTPTGRRYHSSSVEAATEEWKWLGLQAMRGRKPTLLPVRVTLVFRLPSRRRVDLDNLCKLPMDALNGVVWGDDSQVTHLVASKVMPPHGQGPGTSLTVEALRQ